MGEYKKLNFLLLIASIFLTGAAFWGTVHGIKQDFFIPASAVRIEKGASYITVLPQSPHWLFENLPDSVTSPDQSKTELFENGIPLEPAHSLHEDIRNIGLGRFSHWGSTLYFSASDNSDPRTNGRSYKVMTTATISIWVLVLSGLCLSISFYLNRQIVNMFLVRLLGTQSISSPPASRKICWRYGVLAALAMSLLSLYPQIDLWLTRGTDWQGSYASMYGDEEVYAAYINGLILGRPRTVQPLQVDLTKPPSESLFSIQVVPAYMLVFLARVTGATVSQVFIALTPIMAFLSTLMIFYLLALATGDEILAAVGAIVVLLLGTPASRDSVLFKWLLGRRVGGGFLFFLRRYQPAIIFPVFFAFIVLAWRAFAIEGRKAWYAALTAGALFALIIFSYFFLWISALAWLGSLVFLWLMARRWEWRMVVQRLIAIALFAGPAFALYTVMLAHRDRTIDKSAGLVFTHTPDFWRAPEWIAAIVLLLLIRGVIKHHVDWRRPTVLLSGSLALTPLVVFNQQIITGRSLQPVHYEQYSANYLSLLALILTFVLLWQGRETFFTRRVPGFALAFLVSFALCWGGIEANYTIREHRYRNIERDRLIPVAKKLAALAAEHGQDSQSRAVVFSPNLPVISAAIASFAPQAPFWATHILYAGGLSWDKQQERFFQYLYYCGISADALERLLITNDFTAVISLFGLDRYWPELTVDFKPLTRGEIYEKVRQYAEYAASFNRERARHPHLSYLVVYSNTPFDFSNIDRWYSRDAGERIGPFTLYQVKPLDLPSFDRR